MRTVYYCPACGKQYESRIQDGQSIVESFVMLTCINDSCKHFMQTTSPKRIGLGEFIAKHKVTVNFDYITGKRVQK